MTKISTRYWFYQRIALAYLGAISLAYAVLLELPLHVFVIFLAMVIPGIISPKNACKAISLPYVKRILFNYCGSVVPFFVALTILLSGNTPWHHTLVMSVTSIAIISLHTYITSKTVLVNVIRYFITFTSLAMAFLNINEVLYVLPFAAVIGIILGSDIIPFTISLANGKIASHKRIIVGGLMALDSISLVLMLSITILSIVYYTLLAFTT